MPANNDNNPQAGKGKPLPKKESDLFKNVVKHYEMKQYKKAVKQADTILRKFPNHGETLAMKGLVLNCLSKRDEAHTLVKQGLMNDMRNYNEAIKAYKQALRIDSDNIQILRDLSMLQIQMRDLPGFAVTRHTILTLKPNGKINWLAFALAKHLNGDLQGAISVIDIYLGTLTEGAAELARGFEASELALYRNRILSEMPDNDEEALKHLSSCENVVVDRSAWLTTRAKYQLKLGQYDAAKSTTLELFRRGSTENYKVHSMYMCALLELDDKICNEAWELPGTRTLASMLPLTKEQRDVVLEAYKTELFPKYGNSVAMQRIPMNLVEWDRFRSAVDVFIRKGLVKGVPSLCLELSTFFLIEKDSRCVIATDPLDIRQHRAYQLFVELVDGYIDSLAKNKKLLPDDKYEEPPSTELWAWYLRAGLHELAAEYKAGIALLDKCLEHTPTGVDIYELKGRLLKSAGDIEAAVECLDHGRDLDRQDRYINNQTTKYMLEAGMDEKALSRISLFTKHEGNPEANLYEMQCSWYELGLAACYEKQSKWGESLKKYSAVVKHFDDFHEDQFDFHAYCVRKVTLRAYTEVLKLEDNIWGDDYYFRAAGGIVKVYLHLHDNPAILQSTKEPDYSKMTAAEKKKAKAIARKKRIQAEKKEAERRQKEAEASADDGNQKKKGKPSIVDEDPHGKELLKKDPLEEAKKYSAMLSTHCPSYFGTWALQYDVSIRRKKLLLALQALCKMKKIDANHPEYFTKLVDFSKRTREVGDLPAAVREVLVEESATLLEGKTASQFVTDAAQQAGKEASVALPRCIAIAKALVDTNPTSMETAVSLIAEKNIHEQKGVSVESCRDAYKLLKSIGAGKDATVQKWVADVKLKFHLALDFN